MKAKSLEQTIDAAKNEISNFIANNYGVIKIVHGNITSVNKMIEDDYFKVYGKGNSNYVDVKLGQTTYDKTTNNIYTFYVWDYFHHVLCGGIWIGGIASGKPIYMQVIDVSGKITVIDKADNVQYFFSVNIGLATLLSKVILKDLSGFDTGRVTADTVAPDINESSPIENIISISKSTGKNLLSKIINWFCS